MKKNHERYEHLIALLGRGQEHAQKTAALAETLGTDMRCVRGLVEMARNDNILILAGKDGLFLANSPEEAEGWLRTAERKAKTQLRNLRAARRFVQEFKDRQSGQLTLSDM